MYIDIHRQGEHILSDHFQTWVDSCQRSNGVILWVVRRKTCHSRSTRESIDMHPSMTYLQYHCHPLSICQSPSLPIFVCHEPCNIFRAKSCSVRCAKDCKAVTALFSLLEGSVHMDYHGGHRGSQYPLIICSTLSKKTWPRPSQQPATSRWIGTWFLGSVPRLHLLCTGRPHACGESKRPSDRCSPQYKSWFSPMRTW